VALALLATDVTCAEPRVSVNALPIGNTQRTGTAVTYTVTGRTAQLKQTDATNIVNWRSFDIGRDAKLNIVQPSSTSVLLNKVSGGEFQNKTVIEGVLNANGRVYLYNPNGIVFGKTGRVNVNSLIASSLKFDESRVIGGLLRQGAAPVLGADAALGVAPGAVLVEGGAVITAARGGLVLLAAPQVRNEGALNAPDGQVMLAAGSKVYLAAPRPSETGTSLRGLLVEVSNEQAEGLLADANPLNNGTAENAATGRIDVDHGNATMIGYAVNQNGHVSASTSVNLNGSVYLLARDQAVSSATGVVATRSGPLVLGAGSVTEVREDLKDTSKIPATNTFNRSLVRLHGESIELKPTEGTLPSERGAQIVAPGGNVLMLAEHLYAEAPGTNPPDPHIDNARVDLGKGSLIDVSGSHGTTLAMDSNIVTVELRGTELADNLALRDSPLYGSKVRIDARKGTGVGDVSGWLKQRQFGLGEVNANGGTVSVVAGSAIVQREGSLIDVDGGWVDVAGGRLNTTQLRLGNTLVDIGSAKAGVLYDEVVNLSDSAARFQEGYRQGSSAGTVQFSAPVIVQRGALSGKVERGMHQRDPSAVAYPLAARLEIGTLSDNAVSTPVPTIKVSADDPKSGSFGWGWFGRPADGDYGLGWYGGRGAGYASPFRYQGLLQLSASVNANATELPAVGEPLDGLADTLTLNMAALGRAGFTALSARTGGNIEITQALRLAPGSVLQLDASTPRFTPNEGETQPPDGGRLWVGASVTMAGGSFSAKAVSIDVADDVEISAAGLWTNDRALANPGRDAAGYPSDAVAKAGGSVSLGAASIELGDRVGIDVSAGAWLRAAGDVDKGTAGSIAMVVKPLDTTAQGMDLATLVWGSDLRLAGYGFASGGSLKLVGRDVVLGNVSEPTVGDLALAPAFFQQGGFTNYDVGANRDLSVTAGTSLRPMARQWLLDNDAERYQSGRPGDVTHEQLMPLAAPGLVRQATNLTLRAAVGEAPSDGSAEAGRLRVLDGASVQLDPGASLNLRSAGQLEVYGSLNAPGGRIALGLTPFATDTTVHSLWLGPAATLRADGSAARLYTNGAGLTTGELLGGGSITLGGTTDKTADGSSVVNPANAYVVIQPGATLSVQGVSAGELTFKSGSGTTTVDRVSSAGGSIDIRSSLGMELYGSFLGGAGAGASAGSLTLALEGGTDAVLNVVKSGQPVGSSTPEDAQSARTYQGTPGSATVLASGLTDGGFGRLRLRSSGSLGFSLETGDQTLKASQSIVLDAPTLLADPLLRSTTYSELLATAIAELRAADILAGVDERSIDELALAAAPLASARLAGRSLMQDTPATLLLQAPYVQLGDSGAEQTVYPLVVVPDETVARSAMAGNSVLKVKASNIDLKGHTALQGFGTAALDAAQDVRLLGMAWFDPQTRYFDGTQRGSFWMKGALELSSAQVLPTTLSDFTFSVAGSDLDGSGRLSFTAKGLRPQAPLSAGGSITAWAPHIEQAGRLVAPFGSITLGNTDAAVSDILTLDVRYAAGSLTSVAGHGPVPLGAVSNGSVPTASTWATLLADGTEVSIRQNPSAGALTPQRALPGKVVTSLADSITTEAGSVIDLSGGGSLFAYGFTAGKGGSKDVLSNNTLGTAAPAKTAVFAIVPGYTSQLAPVDALYGIDGGLGVGDAVWLSAAGDLKAGQYTLLPAHYALLPGAYSVTLASGNRDMVASANRLRTDGAWLVSGHRANVADGSADTRSQGFVVAPRSVVQRQSEYAIYNAASYFTNKAKAAGVAAPELPGDGGHVAFASQGSANSELRLQGRVLLAAATGGLAGTADVAAPRMEITSGSTTGADGVVALSADQLSDWHARALTLGALHETVDGRKQLDVRTSEMTLSNDAAHPLSAPDVLLAASDTLRLEAQAAVLAESGAAGPAADLVLPESGALLRVSSGAAVGLQRSEAPASGEGKPSGALSIASGAVVSGKGAVQIDVTGSAVNAGSIRVGDGGAFTAAAPQISLGDAIAQNVAESTLALDGLALASLSALDSIDLNSRQGSITVYGLSHLGSGSTQRLTLSGSGIVAGGDDVAQAVFQGDEIVLNGRAGGEVLATSASRGTLAMQGDTIALGSGRMALQGFGQATLSAGNAVRAIGQDGVLEADGTLTLDAPRVTVAPGASGLFQTTGELHLRGMASGTGAQPTPQGGGGGQLGFQAASIDAGTRIEAPSGQIAMTATGAITVNSGVLTVAGAVLQKNGAAAYGPGGSLLLQAPQITLGEQATLDVSSIAADAGHLTISATKPDGTGSVSFGAQLRGAATPVPGLGQPAQGQFTLDTDSAGAAGAFGALNETLNLAGFTGERDFRFRHGDVTLDGSNRIVAHDFTLATDHGSITVAGDSVIDASGLAGGSIRLMAAQATDGGVSGQVTIQDQALLNASSVAPSDAGAGAAGRGGQVLISAMTADGAAPNGVDQEASLHLTGGRIDVSGAPAADGAARRDGRVTLRAPRLADGSDVAVAVLDTEISPGATTVIEGVKVYRASTVTEHADSATNLDATTSGQMYVDAQTFSQQHFAVASRLNRSDAALRAGVEIRSDGDLWVSVNEFAANAADRGWDLNAWHFDGQPVNLTLRAAGNLTVAGSISDGFSKPEDSLLAMPLWALAGGASADLQLVAGADLRAASTTALLGADQVADGKGNLTLDFAARTPVAEERQKLDEYFQPKYELVGVVDEEGNPTSELMPVMYRPAMKEAGGSDIVAPNLDAPVTSYDAPVAVVRTGTGRIDVAAARDVTLAMAKVYVSAELGETLDQPLVYDSRDVYPNFSQTLFGASLYTAGAPLAPGVSVVAPLNALNTHYGATPDTLVAATFADAGGTITVKAGRDIKGPQNSGWYTRNWDSIDPVGGDPEADPKDPGSPGVPGSIAPLPKVVPQMVNNWLFRQGRSTTLADDSVEFETLADQTTTLNTAWWVRPDYFDQGIATLGGGDVTVTAGRSISNLSVSAAGNGQVAVAGAAATEHGGGDLRVQAGGDIAGGMFYVQKGNLSLRADGSLSAGGWAAAGHLDGTQTFAPVLALGDARAKVVAGRTLALTTAYNPTMTEQSINNLPGAPDPLYAPNGNWDPSYAPKADFRTTYAQFSNFSTYAGNSSLALTALGGDVRLSADTSALADAGRSEIPNRWQNDSYAGSFANLYALLPSTLVAAAMGGDVVLANGVTLAPAATGQLDLLASASIRLNNGSTGPLRMLDNSPEGMSTAAVPRVLSRVDIDILDGSSTALEAHAPTGLHSADAVAARLTAVNGDVQGDASFANSLSLPKAAVITAGRDIVDLGFRIQQLAATDKTVLQADRDVVDTTQSNGVGGFPSDVSHVMGGPGQLVMSAARHVDLGNGNGVVTRGNLDNVYLPDGGAAIRVVAGSAPADYGSFVAFAKAYGSAADLAAGADLAALGAFVSAQGGAVDVAALDAFVRAQGQALPAKATAAQVWAAFQALAAQQQSDYMAEHPALAAQAWTAFRALPSDAQSQYLTEHKELAARVDQRADDLAGELARNDDGQLDTRFFALLVETGNASRKSDAGKVIDDSLRSFDALIASLFPQTAAPMARMLPQAAASNGGDISNFGSQFKTEQGGAITLYAPAGSVFAGLTAGNSQKPSEADTGIFTVRGGAVSGLVRDDFLVNKGRVFTLGGGDITLVSQRANIDAGKGAKTAASAPPPLLTVDKDGRVSVDVASSISGSGIATLKTRADAAPGDVFAIAPRGVFDAGDAGVRSSGSVLVVAPVVRNADNISASGSIAGAQVSVAAPSLGAIAAPANATQKSDDAAKAAANPNGAAASSLVLTVEALGFGDAENAGSNDPDGPDSKKKKKR
jgi:filamentous hemagglutinin family protein